MPSSPRLAILAIALVACSSMACGQCPPAAADTIVIPLAVRVHPKATLNGGDAKDILSRSSGLLKAANGNDDCACPVELLLESFGAFAGTNDGEVNTKSDFDALFADTFASPSNAMTADPNLAPRLRQVRVVSAIYWCGAGGMNVAGCADEPGLRIAITRRSPLLEAELWAHETGHTRGLAHRNSSWTAVMHEAILPDHTELTVAECDKYRR